MQVVPVVSTGISTGSAHRGGAVPMLPGVRPDAAPDAAVPAAAEGGFLPRGGLRAWNPQLNQQFAGAQQALGFLDEVAGQLKALEGALGRQLVVRDPVASPQLSGQLEQLARTWRARPAIAGGSLDSQLRYSAAEPARQRFTVRGLDLQRLRAGERETLSFTVAGGDRRAAAVSVDAALPDKELLQRFDHALAAAGIRVARGAGDLVFETPESAWPAVRDSLAIKGDGIRFPTGQFHRVRADAEPEAMQPQGWRLEDGTAMRRTLQEVVRALDLVRGARERVGAGLAEAGRQLDDARPADDAAWAENFAARFQALLQQPNYDSHSSVAAAVSGMRRDRVQALLALR